MLCRIDMHNKLFRIAASAVKPRLLSTRHSYVSTVALVPTFDPGLNLSSTVHGSANADARLRLA